MEPGSASAERSTDDDPKSMTQTAENSPNRLMARCRACAASFTLESLAIERTGCCPGCGRELSPGWTTLLVEEAENIETLRAAFIRALRRLAGLPGLLEVVPDAVIRDIEEVPWQRNITTEPARLSEQVRRVRVSWERDRAEGIDSAESEIPNQLRALADDFLELGRVMDLHQEATGLAGSPAGQVARELAERLSDDAASISDHRGTPDVTARLDQADAATDAAEQQAKRRTGD